MDEVSASPGSVIDLVIKPMLAARGERPVLRSRFLGNVVPQKIQDG